MPTEQEATVTDPVRIARRYAFDHLDRLVRVEVGDDGVISYTLDAAGNRVGERVDAPEQPESERPPG